MCWASKFGDLNAIERLYMEGGEDIFDVEQAVCHGHLHVLEWWKGKSKAPINPFNFYHCQLHNFHAFFSFVAAASSQKHVNAFYAISFLNA